MMISFCCGDRSISKAPKISMIKRWHISIQRVLMKCINVAQILYIVFSSFVNVNQLKWRKLATHKWHYACVPHELDLELEKCLLDKKQIQARNNVINDTYRMFYVGRPLQRRWAHRWRKSHPTILQCMNRHHAHEVLTFWEHKFGICNQNESTPLGKAPSRHTRGTQLT